MAWLRIDDRVRTHPKVVTAGPAAAWFWFCGIAYCRQHLTDGFIPEGMLPSLAPGVSNWRSLSGKLIEVRLWERVPSGYQVHDFLDWNPSRAEVEAARKADLERKRNLNGRTVESGSFPDRNPNGIQTTPSRDRAGARGTALSQGSLSSEESPRETTDPEAIRAAKFLETYQALYSKHRHGAHYALKPARDYQHAVGLVQAYKDDERLTLMAELYLMRDDREVEGKARTVGEFAHMAPWCDSRLREAGR